MPQVCEALQYAHEQGVVHRDIKPENILITRDGRVKIADFGLAKLAGHAEQPHLTGTWQVMGTPHYMAPEQVERPTEVDHRADIYSLGVVFYEMLTGELPLGRFPLPSSKAQLDIRLDEVVLRSLEKAPERRYQHATDVQTDVEQIRQTPGTRTSPKAAKPEDRFAGKPEVVRERVLADLSFSANALVILGLAELVLLAIVVLFITPLVVLTSVTFGDSRSTIQLSGVIPWLLLVTLPVATITVWTGLSLKTGENARASLIGGGLSLIPVSLLWGAKLIVLVMAWLWLRDPRARAAFGSVTWREGPAFQQMQDSLRKGWAGLVYGAGTLWQAIWNRVPSAATTQAAVAAVKERAAHLPERAAPTVRTVAAVIRHPVVRGFVGWAFWSVVWSVWCIVSGIMAVELTELRMFRFRVEHDRLFTATGLVVNFCWLIGEVVLSWICAAQCLLRLKRQPSSRVSGPQIALSVAGGVSLLMAIVLLVGEALGATERWSTWYQLGRNPAGFDEIGLIQLMFALCCGLSAALLRWPGVRWVTRILLLLAVAFPAALLLVMSVDMGRLPSIALTLWPTAMSLPAVLWGCWGTRRTHVAPMKPAEPVQPAEPSGLASTTV